MKTALRSYQRAVRVQLPLLFAAFALSACAPGAELSTSPAPPPTGASTVPGDQLPRALYFLSRDDAGLAQVFRIDRDGTTKAQLTSEPVDVIDYDVSMADGSIAYVADNRLLLVDAGGLNRRLLADGGARESSYWITNPVFAPEGKTLAYGLRGVNLYDLAAQASHLLIEDLYSTVTLPGGLLLPTETYEPEVFSPDGAKLLVAVGHPPDSPQTAAIYTLATGSLVHLSGGAEGLTCCNFFGGAQWSPGSSSLHAVASVYDSSYRFGVLWQVDGTSGAVTTLIPGRSDDGPFNVAVEPYLAPDNQLYSFFGSYDADSGYLDAPVVSLVRSSADGVTGRAVLRDENYVLMTEALWDPDASFVIVSMAPSRTWYLHGGVLELYYTDGRKDAVWLAPLGYQLKWGP